jgi:hypothetical protein
VVADLAEGDFQLPALDEPADDLQWLLRRVGAEQGLRIEAPAGTRSSTQRIGTTGRLL